MRAYQSAFVQLACPECGRVITPESGPFSCPECAGPLFAVYDLPAARLTLTRESLAQRSLTGQTGLWRWTELLPVSSPSFRLTLGETSASLLKADNLGLALGLSALYIKDESRGPLGTQDSRGMLVAVARALEMGAREFVMAACGTDGAALAACAARSHTRAHVYMPKSAPAPEQVAVRTFGAELILVDSSFSDAAKLAAESASAHGWTDFSAFREPYRCEGAKTIGLEIAEAFAWDLPDVLVVPDGAGLEFLGIWKAFNELEQLGFIGARRPRLVLVQARGCAPLVRAFESGAERADPWPAADTAISALCVPTVFADRPILRALMASQGIALAVSDAEIFAGQREMAVTEGIFGAPQAGAALAAAKKLLADGWLRRDERVVLMNSGSGLNYL